MDGGESNNVSHFEKKSKISQLEIKTISEKKKAKKNPPSYFFFKGQVQIVGAALPSLQTKFF